MAGPDAAQDDVVAVAKAAAAHDFIMGFPKGYDTPVAELGARRSLAGRSSASPSPVLCCWDPRILILDDSTSSVTFRPRPRYRLLWDLLMRGRTSFVIAQRISTVRNADLIIVLDKGLVVAMGKHTDLLESGPSTRDLPLPTGGGHPLPPARVPARGGDAMMMGGPFGRHGAFNEEALEGQGFPAPPSPGCCATLHPTRSPCWGWRPLSYSARSRRSPAPSSPVRPLTVSSRRRPILAALFLLIRLLT